MHSRLAGTNIVADPDRGLGIYGSFGYRFAPRLSGMVGYRNTWMQAEASYRISELDGSLAIALGRAKSRLSPFVELSVSRQSIIQGDLIACATDGSVCFRTTGETIGRAAGVAGGLSYFMKPHLALTATAGHTWSTFSSVRFGGQKRGIDYDGTSQRIQFGILWYARPDAAD